MMERHRGRRPVMRVSKHPATKVPWEFRAGEDQEIMDAEGNGVVYTGDDGGFASNADGRFAVMAVNTHDALVEAVRTAIDQIRRQPRWEDAGTGYSQCRPRREVLGKLEAAAAGGKARFRSILVDSESSMQIQPRTPTIHW
jgi:hypothetical protein